MAKVITLSRTFPAYHSKKGEPTYFVEKVWNSIDQILSFGQIAELSSSVYGVLGITGETMAQEPKHHTIRAGKRWKTGDMASLRVWSGKPHRSPQIIIAPDVELAVKDIEISYDGEITIDGKFFAHPEILAENDGLTEREFDQWFNKLPFSGQILIWNSTNLSY